MSQLSFISLAHAKKELRREVFLKHMEQIIPWQRLLDLLLPFYDEKRMGRHKMPLVRMLKILCLQQWYNLSDPAMEEEIYDRMTFQTFLEIDLLKDPVPDETTILNFRHFLEEHGLQGCIFEEIKEFLTERGFLMKQGTIVDATLIAAPPSTKNKQKQRDPEMSSTKKNNQWYFGMKTHIGVDAESGLVHTVIATTAKRHDSTQLEELLHGEEKEIFGDKAYADEAKARACDELGIVWGVLAKAPKGGELTQVQKDWNLQMSRIRAAVEHPFQVIKCQWGHRKARYRGIAKNWEQFYLLFGLHNLFKVRKKLLIPA